jgi:N-carbamoylputrescine amidase
MESCTLMAMKKTGTVIGLIQMQCSSDPTENMHHAEERVREAASFGASIICLPELFLSPYFCQKKDDTNAFSLAETIPGKTTNALSALAKDLGIVLIGGSLFEKTTDGKYYNTAPVFGPDGALMGAYRKTHIPEDPCFHEQHYFSPGDTGIQVFHTPFGNLFVTISGFRKLRVLQHCWGRRFFFIRRL